MRRRVKPIALLAVLFAAGFLLAGGLGARGAADPTTTETTTTTVPETTTTTVRETTTAPATTVVTTAVPPTTPTTTTPPTTPTTTASSSTSSTPTWVWVLLAALAAGVVGLAVALLMRRSGPVAVEEIRRGGPLPVAERRQRLDNAIATWAAQGWALESQTPDSAILQRGGERLLVNVGDTGHIDARPLAGP
jgi:hypothetical protein